MLFAYMFIAAVIGQIVSGFANTLKLQAAEQSKRGVVEALIGAPAEGGEGGIYGTQKARITTAYQEQARRIQETAGQVAGTQTQALGLMGQVGGEGSAAAGILEVTEARRASDSALLDKQFTEAIADLDAQKKLALTQLDADYRTAMAQMASQAIIDMANLGLNTFGNMLKLSDVEGITLLTQGQAAAGGAGGFGPLLQPL